MNVRHISLTLAALGCVALAPTAFPQAGNDNPGGVTNEYHGSSEVAGQMDPYTGSGRREIDDIVVTGSIGAYPLKFTRILSTRGSGASYQFGEGGGWTHSYAWGLWVRPAEETTGHGDGEYTGPFGGLTYPGGGGAALWDNPEEPIDYVNGKHGPIDKLINTGSGYYELRRADGGKVLFRPAVADTYQAYKIIDPYGQPTTLDYDSIGKLSRVTEPGGRYLEFFYQNFSYWVPGNPPRLASEDVISMVQANDGRGNVIETVSYAYESAWIYNAWGSALTYNLKTVSYDDSSVASYNYVSANTDYSASSISHQSAQVVQSCDDPRYAGPMKQIRYEYVQRGEADPGYVARGQLKAEKNLYGQVVSRITFPISNNDPTYLQRTETRGDGQSRSFNYLTAVSNYEFSFTWTDFKNQTFTDTTLGTLPGWRITDALTNATTYEVEPVLGALRKITYPQNDPNQAAATKEYTFTDPANPRFHAGEKDENDYWTYFDRDASNRVWRTRYPDGSTEQFTYNSLDQVLTHTLRSGGTETFTYDTRGLKQTSYPPATPSDPDPWNHPTRYYYYQSGPNTDRLYCVVDPRGNGSWYEYNQRGQATKVTHQDGKYVQSGYYLDGTLAWTADENHPGAATDPNQRTRFEYDEYKRVAATWKPGETLPTTNCYALDSAWYDPGLRKPLLHTTNSVKYTLSPMGKNVVYDYDENLRKIDQVVALGTPDDESWTLFEYDAVGNLKKTTDPRSKVTVFGYDARNRKSWMDSPVASDRASTTGHTMTWQYDGVGNKLKETRADNAFRSWDYDIPNRITHSIDWRMSTSEPAITTTHERNIASTVETTKDAKNAVYTFTFDALHRKIAEAYPAAFGNSSPSETFLYDAAGNLILYKNPAGQYKHLDYADSYDSRNRLRHSGWNMSASPSGADPGVGQEIRTDYDAASRVISITTNNGETTVAFGYDDANRKLWEDQTVAGYPTRGVVTPHDADGNRTNLEVYTSGALIYGAYYDYTPRNQLSHIYWDSNQTPWFTYTYDAAGNRIKRQDVFAGVNDSTNIQSASYDGLNRPTFWEETGVGDAWFARSHYQYDSAGREVATWRDEDGKGERFSYDPMNQITDARYQAEQVDMGNAVNPQKTQTYLYTLDKLNRQSVTENGVVANYVTNTNGMNQITQWNGQTVQYDGNFNFASMGGWIYAYDAENHLMSLGNPTPRAQFVYDGLGRCVKRIINGVAKVITYDDWKPIMEWNSATQLDAWNVYGPGSDEILWRNQAGVGYLRYHSDPHGNVTAVLDYWGNIREKYTYDAFGRPTILSAGNTQLSTSAIGNRFMFQGREYFSELGLYDYRHRFYDPTLGRFIQTDPTGFDAGDMNLFRYCGDDPVDKSDPTGLFNIWGNLHSFFTGNPSMTSILADWNASLIRGLMSGAKEPAAKQSSKADSPAQNQPGVPDYAIRVPEHQYPTHHGSAHIIWKITLFHHKNEQHLGSGIDVSEQVTFSNGLGFTAKEKDLTHFSTREDGSVPDIWDLPFDRPDGRVTVTQTISAGGRQATWVTTVLANGQLKEPQQYAPFH